MSIDPKKFGLSDSLVNAVNEALKGNQHKIDVAEPKGKITGADFKKLRGEQAPGESEKQNYKHDMMKSEVADGNKANFKQNMKEGSKPDFLDLDKDGNKKEPMKHAAKQVGEAAEKKVPAGHYWSPYHGKVTKMHEPGTRVKTKHGVGVVKSAHSSMDFDDDNDSHYKVNVNGKTHEIHADDLVGKKMGPKRINVKEEVEQVNETVETTHENPLVTVHDKNGLHTHANLSTANKIFNTNVKHTDVHKGDVTVTSGHKDKNKLKFAISKHHATRVRKLTKEEAEQVDEISDTTLKSYRTKAMQHSMGHQPGDSPETQANRNRKTRNRSQGVRTSWNKMIGRYVKVGGSGKKTYEEVEQVDELSKKTLGSYVTKASDKAATHTGAAAHYGSGGTGNNPAKMAVHQAIATKRKAGIQKAVDKLTKEEAQVDEAAPTVAGANVAAQMAARKKEVQLKIAQKQAATQQAKSNKRLSGTMKEDDKCSCGSTNESKMNCEVHGGKHNDKDAKLGREPIKMNPPLREAGELPKKVVSKGHEIAKSLIRHKTKVDNPYAVGMAAAKKSAGIKD